MKMKLWMVLTVTALAGFFAAELLADEQPGAATNTPPVIPADQVPAAPKPEKKKKPASAPKKPAADAKKSAAGAKHDKAAEAAGPGVSPGPAVVKQENVNARGQAAINSEVVVRLKRGERVNVLEEVTLKKPKPDEPAKWARIALPATATVWIHSGFIDPNSKTVVPKKLKLRSGPGENYSVLGTVTKGTAVKEIETKGDWLKIEAPAEASSFVAAHLIAHEAMAPAAALAAARPTPPAKPLTETTVASPTPVVAANDNAPPPASPTIAPPTRAVPPPPASPEPVAIPPPAPAPPQEEILVRRVVTREGIVYRSLSIQAPTLFTLVNVSSGKTIDYLHPADTNIVILNFLGKRIVVTGEELLDERWPNTPVIEVESLQAVP